MMNITRRQVDKQMLDIPSVEEITQQFPEVTESPKKDILMNAFIKRIDGIDIFGQFIANIVKKRCLREKTNRDNDNNDDNLSLNMKRLYELPLNRLIDLLPVVFNTLDESEQQSLVSHIFDRFIGLASSEEYRQLNAQNIDFLFTKVNQLSDEHNSEVNPIGKQVTDGLFKQLANAIKFMVKMFKKCSLKIGDIDTEEELIQLFVITFSLALDMRLITDIEWIMDLKELITLNELEMDYSLQSIQLILNQIDWKQLNREHIHAIIKLISQSMDLPNDLLHYKETICQILKTLDFQINICVPKASDFEALDAVSEE
ncbi:unnamed protein product [Medioppia subpectinata]|uniref:Uncharacterized protein n=1 Tax=Medioppia subpectinata TaxID=1979941 RepID=A0A7R9LJW5_9ACAR|nr:unnamed protein product [Medioppia subpectinata]CAG2119464.1 unnamed protein product [Medioppia subpectinata]